MIPSDDHQYEIHLTQADLFIQLSSDDMDFISREIQRWFNVFWDETLKPIPIPPGNVRIPASAEQSQKELPPAPVPIASPTSQEVTVSNTESEKVLAVQEQNEMLRQQLQALQSQVQQLLVEKPVGSPSVPLPPSPPEPLPQLQEVPPEPPPVESPIDVFASPAHEEVQASFDMFSSEEPAETVETNTFEQPVENPPISVDNLETLTIEESIEVLTVSTSLEEPSSFQQPVQNDLPLTTPEDPIAPDVTVSDFDEVLDSLSADLGEAPIKDEPVVETIIATPLPEPDPIFPTEAPIEPPPEAPPKEVDPVEEALKDAFEEEPTNVPEVPEIPEEPTDPNEKLYAPPLIEYDFGIPGVEATDDREIRRLSIETLQDEVVTAQNYESPFRAVKEEDIDQKATRPGQRFEVEEVEPPKPEPDLASLTKDLADGPDSEEMTKQTIHDALHAETLAELCEMAPNAKTGSDHLLLSAYYLIKMKQVEKFSLKDLNAQLLRSRMTPVNHSMMETTITSGLMQLVPDLTGTAHAAEYTLTEEGEAHVKSLFSHF